MSSPGLLSNTPWWLPDVSVSGAKGMTVKRCDPFGNESQLRGLEGGFYGPEHLGPNMWHCQARAELRVRMTCRCNHTGRIMEVCPGHARMITQRMSGVCPRCVHPPREIEIQHEMQGIRTGVSPMASQAELSRAETRLWDLQAELNWLVEHGVAHRCPLRLKEVS